MLRNIKTYPYFYYPLIFLILLVLIFIIGIRLSLPKVSAYKNEIQSIITDYVGYSVNIHAIQAEWKGWTPNLYLEDIKILSQNNNTEIIKFKSARIGINLIESIYKQNIIPGYILISGLNLEIYRTKNGVISIRNENIDGTNTNKQTGLSEWLISQKHLILEDVNLIWKDENINIEKKEFNNIRLDLKTKGENTKIELNTALSKSEKQLLRINANITGNILMPDWDANIDIEISNIDPVKNFSRLNLLSNDGAANGKISTYWQNAKLITANGDLEYTDFSLTTNEYSVPVKNINLSFAAARKLDKNWSLKVDLHHLKTVNGVWSPSEYQFEFTKDDTSNKYQYKGFFTFLKLEDIFPLIVETRILPNNILQKLDLNSISGDIKDVNIEVESNKESSIKIDAAFSKLNLTSYDKSSYITGLEGTFITDDSFFNIKIDSKSPEFKSNTLYSEKIVLPNLSTVVKLNRSSYDELLINKFKMSSDEISLTANGKIILTEDSPFVDVKINLDESDIKYVSTLIPSEISPKLSKWATNSILGGKILSGEIVYKGYGKDLIFENPRSNFKALFNLGNINLKYHPEWPSINKLGAEVVVDNDELSANVTSGYILDTEINNTSAKIKNLSGNYHHVLIDTKIYTHTNNVKNFIAQSPLNETKITEITENIIGNVDISLNLDIPLNEEKTKFNSLVSFDKTSIESGIPELGLENVSGEIHFNNDEIWANNINALYQGIPVTLKLPKINYSELDFIPFEISGFVNKEFIINQITSFFPGLFNKIENIRTYFSGQSQWTFTLQKSRNNDIGSSNKRIKLSTDLYDTEINLPSPLGKKENELRTLKLEADIDEITVREININYDNRLFADIFIDNSNELLVKNINIGLEKKHPESKADNTISIQGEIDNLSFTDWGNLLNTSKNIENEKKQEKILLGKIFVGNLEILNKNFKEVSIDFTNSKINKDWYIIFDGKEINGEASYIKKSKGKNDYLYINFQNLSLSENKNIEDLTNYKINKIPELEVTIDNFMYKNNELGSLKLKTSKTTENLININKLNFKKSGFSINASGSWSKINKINESNFHIKLESDLIKQMFNTFNYGAANIEDGKTSIDISAKWNGSPMDFQMKNLNGQLSMSIEEGQFLEIEPKAGRLFGLLSIQALPRRLSLDFADLFDEGFAFDTIKGNFNLENGQAYTNDLQMIGPSGNIMISGRTGLVTEDYDQIATVIPKVSDSLPVASALFGPVGVGVGAVLFVAGELFESIPTNIDKILTQQYSIKGSWEDPEINKINSEQ